MSGHVLLISNDPKIRTHLCDRLNKALFRVSVCTQLADLDLAPFDCVLAAPDAQITNPPATCPPILAIQNHMTDVTLGHSAQDVIRAPYHDRELIARIRAMIRRFHATRELKLREGTNRALGFHEAADGFAHRRPCFVLTPDGTLPKALHPLTQWSFVPQTQQAFQQAVAKAPIDAVAIVVRRQDTEKLGTMILDLRAHPHTRYAAIFCLVDAVYDKIAHHALELGADDVIQLHAPRDELAHRLSLHWTAKETNDALRQSNQIGLYAAVTDTLTGLFNRRYAMTHIQHLCKMAQGKNGSVTALMIDIDHFKRINDAHGHFVGDQVLVSVAETLKSAVRASDLVARIGGEEFIIALPDIKERDAKRLADRLCRLVRNITFDMLAGPVTISIGVSRYDPTSFVTYNHPDILEQADTALYAAKRNGRDQVSYFTQF